MTSVRTIVDAIADSAGGLGTLTVLGPGRSAQHTVNWTELHLRARRMSNVLTSSGLGPGSRVGLLTGTSVGTVTAAQAVWLIGGSVTILPQPVQSGLNLGTLTAIAADAALDLILIDPDQTTAGTALSDGTRIMSLSDLEAAAELVPALPVHRPGPDDLAVLQYTSGSTRTPRGVPVTHGHLAANIAAIDQAISHDPATARWMSWLPLYHDMGLIAFLCLPMSHGCPLVLQAPATFAMRPASWLEVLSEHRITHAGAPNFAYQLMTQLLRTTPMSIDLTSIRLMSSGGEPIDVEAMEQFAAAAAPAGLDPGALIGAYGLAESTLAVAVSPPGQGIRADAVDAYTLEHEGLARPGRKRLVRYPPIPGVKVRIIGRVTHIPVGERVVGQIEVQGPSVVGHYWGDPPMPPGHWLRTGDLGYLAEGDLVVCGREKDVLFAAGRNLYPQDIEAIAAQVAGVRSGGVTAFGIPGLEGDRLIIAVESRARDLDDVRRAVTFAVVAELGMRPADVVTLPYGRLPKTSSGKVRRAEMRRRYLTGEGAQGSPAPQRRNRPDETAAGPDRQDPAATGGLASETYAALSGPVAD